MAVDGSESPDAHDPCPGPGEAGLEPATLAPPGRRGPVWLAAFVGLLVAANIGSVGMSTLVRDRPGLLLALSARNRHLVLTVPSDLGPLVWATIGAARLTVSAVVCHYLGRAYGDRALRWFWRYMGMRSEQVDRFERGFTDAEIVLIPFFVGSNIVWVLSGAARTRWRRLAPLAAAGIAARLSLVWWLATQFERPLTTVIDFTTDNQRWFLVGTLVLVVFSQMRNLRGR